MPPLNTPLMCSVFQASAHLGSVEYHFICIINKSLCVCVCATTVTQLIMYRTVCVTLSYINVSHKYKFSIHILETTIVIIIYVICIE